MSADFFSEAANIKPHFKCALEGFAGSGKTYTAALVARGLHQAIGSTLPIVMFDTERAAKFLIPVFRDAGIQLLVKDSRSMADLRETMQRCADGASDVLIIDSISHVWESFVAAYKAKAKRTRLEFQDWGILKPTWKEQFSDPFVRDPLHVLMCGRAGYEYETEVDDRGKRQIYKSGVKMKVEGETAYEPDMLVLMERFEEVLERDKKVWREATILKDRSNKIDGKTFRNPSFADFEPAIQCMLADGAYRAPGAEGDTGAMFVTEEDKARRAHERKVLLEKIQGDLTLVWPGQTREEKALKVEALRVGFDTTSWKEVEGYHAHFLLGGYRKVRAFIYAQTQDERFADAAPDDDDVPDFTPAQLTDAEKAEIEAAERADPAA